MSNHPVNLFLRLLLEVTGMVVCGVFGYTMQDEWWKIPMAILLPLLFAVLWGVFAVRDDPSRSGKTVVQTPGWIRLILELGLFSTATWMLTGLAMFTLAWVFAAIVAIHYIISYDRILWLLKQK